MDSVIKVSSAPTSPRRISRSRSRVCWWGISRCFSRSHRNSERPARSTPHEPVVRDEDGDPVTMTGGCNDEQGGQIGALEQGALSFLLPQQGTVRCALAAHDGRGRVGRQEWTLTIEVVTTGYAWITMRTVTAVMSRVDDSDAGINPSVQELCNGVDDNCNGAIDEGC